MPPRMTAIVRMVGDPRVPGKAALPALYGAGYAPKSRLQRQGVEFRVEPLRARWPDVHLVPRKHWTGICALPVPDGTTELPARTDATGTHQVVVERWAYGVAAQLLRRGPYATDVESIARLHAFVDKHGNELAGPHEEEYLTRLDAKEPRTVIRYRVRPRAPMPV